MTNKFKIRPDDISTDANVQKFVMEKFLSGKAFITLAMVKATYPGNENEMSFVDVQPMIHGSDGTGALIERGVIYNAPVFRLQRGSSALIMDPVVGDIGWIACCDEDIRTAKKTAAPALPASARSHSYGDAIYMGGILNSRPTQYIKFADDGIDIVSPLLVNVNGNVVSINADSRAEINAPVILLNGAVAQGEGSYGGAAHFKNKVTSDVDFQAGVISLVGHKTSGVQYGNDTSGLPVP
ncbi:oxidoreductase [Atlantibacter hermannii]|uniref:oxidoreductase n=1 Tax=Atlantibacter hermannii TaxID=565 RepID=UPI002899DC26|nr:oxidoreductase [Atlantibacter hermannii]